MVFSAVRANHNGNVGFVKDWRRLNVTVTRARSGLIVVGHAPTLAQERTIWRPYIDWLQSQQLLVGAQHAMTGGAAGPPMAALPMPPAPSAELAGIIQRTTRLRETDPAIAASATHIVDDAGPAPVYLQAGHDAFALKLPATLENHVEVENRAGGCGPIRPIRQTGSSDRHLTGPSFAVRRRLQRRRQSQRQCWCPDDWSSPAAVLLLLLRLLLLSCRLQSGGHWLVKQPSLVAMLWQQRPRRPMWRPNWEQ